MERTSSASAAANPLDKLRVNPVDRAVSSRTKSVSSGRALEVPDRTMGSMSVGDSPRAAVILLASAGALAAFLAAFNLYISVFITYIYVGKKRETDYFIGHFLGHFG